MSRYEWVPVEEDLPPDDPKFPGCSVKVYVKISHKNTYRYAFGFYDYNYAEWCSAGSGYLIKGNVVAWTNDY